MARIASKTVTDGGVTFAFADGETLTATLLGMSDDIITRLAIHGLSQKVGDSYAGAESINEAHIMAKGVIDNLMAGLWAVKAARGGKIVEALHRATKQPLEACLEKYSLMDDAAKKELRKHPAIKKAMADIEAENAAKMAEVAGDSGDDLNELF